MAEKDRKNSQIFETYNKEIKKFKEPIELFSFYTKDELLPENTLELKNTFDSPFSNFCRNNLSPLQKSTNFQMKSLNNILKEKENYQSEIMKCKEGESTNIKESFKENIEKKKYIEKLDFPSSDIEENGILIIIKTTSPEKKLNEFKNQQKSKEKIIIFNANTNLRRNFPNEQKTKKLLINNINSITCSSGQIVQNIIDKQLEINENKEINEVSLTKKYICNCKKSKCLKLYCECFSNGSYCGIECNCFGCWNNKTNEEQRKNNISSYKEKNPMAFTPKIESKDNLNNPLIKSNEIEKNLIHSKGCNCRKSNCLKKYCECFQAGIKCGDYCKCNSCKNTNNLINKKIKISPKRDSLKQIEPFNYEEIEIMDNESNYNSISFGHVNKKNINVKKQLLNNFNSFHNVLNEDKNLNNEIFENFSKKIKTDDQKKIYQKQILRTNYVENVNIYSGNNKLKFEIEK